MTVSSNFLSALIFSLMAPPNFSVFASFAFTSYSITLYFGSGGKSFVSNFTGGGGVGNAACLASPSAASFSVVTAFSSSLRLFSLASATDLALSAFSAASFNFSLASFSTASACSMVSLRVFGGGLGAGGLDFGSGLVYTGGGTGAGGSYAGIIGFFGFMTGAGLGYGFGGAGSGSSAVDSFTGVERFFSGIVSLVVGIGRTPS
jgi:hypothetical protein